MNMCSGLAAPHEHALHDHQPLAAGRERRLKMALALNAVTVAAQVTFGLIGHSLGLLADAAHNLTDVAAIGLALVAVRMTTRRPTVERSFGYHRSTVLAAQANGVIVLAVTLGIAVEAARRFAHPGPVHGGIVLAVAGVALVANTAAALAVHDGTHDLNMRSAMLHLVGDAAASAGVAGAGLVMLLTGGARWLDPAVSLAIGALIAWEAVRLLRQAVDVLLESTPGGMDLAELAAVMTAVAGVEGVHDIHVWSLSSDVRALSAHLVMAGHPTLEEAQAVADEVKRAVGTFAISHATLELECESCDDPCAMEDLAGNMAGAGGALHQSSTG
jgi:cobalt-zinc-cadmium efflux system protein